MDAQALQHQIAALADSERRMRSIVETIGDGLIVVDVDGQVQLANRAAQRIFGLDPAHPDTSGSFGRDLNVIDEDGRPCPPPERPTATTIATGQPCRDVIRGIVATDGTVMWLSVNTEPIVDEATARTVAAVATFRDITEPRRAHHALRESQEKLRLFVEHAPAAIVMLDRELRYVLASRRWLDDYRLTLDDIVGLRHYDVFPEIPERWKAVHQRCLAGATEQCDEDAFSRQDGSIDWVKWAVRPWFDADGNVGGIMIASESITLRKEAEERLREAELRHQAELAQGQKLESIGRLAGGVAHDFNNMLAVIIGNTQLAALELGDGHPLRPYLHDVLFAAQRSADLTRQLLGFARRQTIAPRVLDVNETIASSLRMLRRLMGENLTLSWVPGPGVGQVEIDPAQLDQILANLLANARDAIAGVGRIIIETANVVLDDSHATTYPGLVPGDYVQIMVSDTGAGMSREVLEHLFEPFFTTKALGRGTGLGLATVYGIVKQNRGFVHVYSEPGSGTTFRVYLPRVHEPAVREPVRPPEPPGGRGETVLLVEDEPPILKLVTIMLNRLGYAVLAAGSPQEAMQIVATHVGPLDVLVTDVVMPQMNGRDLLEQLKALAPGLRCLFVSGYTADVIAHHGVVDEGVSFLQKPFSLEQLAVRLRDVLDA